MTLSDLKTRLQGHGIIISVYAADARSVCDSLVLVFVCTGSVYKTFSGHSWLVDVHTVDWEPSAAVCSSLPVSFVEWMCCILVCLIHTHYNFCSTLWRGWLRRSMPAGSITAGPKSVTRAMGAASLCRGTIASANQTPIPLLWKRCWYMVCSLSGATPSTWLYLFHLYAAETWTLAQAERQGLEAFEMWIWSRMKISSMDKD